MKRLFLESRLRVALAAFALFQLLTLAAVAAYGPVPPPVWVLTAATLLLAGFVAWKMRSPFNVLNQVRHVLELMCALHRT